MFTVYLMSQKKERKTLVFYSNQANVTTHCFLRFLSDPLPTDETSHLLVLCSSVDHLLKW